MRNVGQLLVERGLCFRPAAKTTFSTATGNIVASIAGLSCFPYCECRWRERDHVLYPSLRASGRKLDLFAVQINFTARERADFVAPASCQPQEFANRAVVVVFECFPDCSQLRVRQHPLTGPISTAL